MSEPSEMPAVTGASGSERAPELRGRLQQRLEEARARAADDPFVDPVGCVGVDLFRTLRQRPGEVAAAEELVRALAVEAFVARARRLRRYLGETDPEANRARLAVLVDGLLDRAGEDPHQLAAALAFITFGFVFTAHPTFAVARELQDELVDLALERDREGRPLDGAARLALLARVAARPHRPDAPLDLAYEQAYALEAMGHLAAALRTLWRVVAERLRARRPEDWRRLVPRLVSIATWVGYDTDGRADIPWSETFARRMIVAEVQLRHYRERVRALRAQLGEDDPRLDALEVMETRLSFTIHTLSEAVPVFLEVAAATREGGSTGLERLAAVARRLAEARPSTLHDKRELLQLLDRCLAHGPDDEVTLELWLLRAEVATLGLGRARSHLRINARQIHNAVRHQVGLDHAPDDPSWRLSYLDAIHRLVQEVQPVAVNFGSLAHEPATARRAFMLCAKMLQHVDGGEPIRFLIAECETSFTLLAALYLARLFGVDDAIDISPLFETPRALERGAGIIDEALSYPAFRAYVERRGRLTIQTGFSDAGRYMGQLAAADAIERIRLDLVAVLQRHGLDHLELVIFDTHGESMGRGAHPASLADRLAYFDTPHSRRLFAAAGLRQRQETSFQGGDGFLLFARYESALAVLTRALEHRLAPPPADDDPFYARPPYVDEFFATIRQYNRRLFEDPDYAAFLGAFGPHLLYRTGSRSSVREHELATPPPLEHPSQLRAIPHNAILQQLGMLVHVIGGVGRAMARDPEAFERLYRTSDRFRRLVSLVEYAFMYSDPLVTKAYIDLFDAGGWLLLARRCPERDAQEGLREVADHFERLGLHERLARIFRFMFRDHLDLAQALRDHRRRTRDLGEEPIAIDLATRDNLHLLHAVRLAAIRTLAELAARIPDFSDRHRVTREEVVERLLRLDVEPALQLLVRIFPLEEHGADRLDWGEAATYAPTASQSYAQEHEQLFRPMARLHELMRQVTTAVVHHVGAVG